MEGGNKPPLTRKPISLKHNGYFLCKGKKLK